MVILTFMRTEYGWMVVWRSAISTKGKDKRHERQYTSIEKLVIQSDQKEWEEIEHETYLWLTAIWPIEYITL